MEWSIYNHLYYSQKAQAYLLYSSLSNMLIELDEDTYKDVLNIKENPNSIDLKNKEHEILYNGRFVVQSNETEVNKLMLSALSQRFNSTALNLTIAPTRACNFNCSYCYENDRENKKMSEKTQNAIVDFVKRNDNTKSVHIVWYGGEPTLAKDIIESLSTKLQDIVENYSAYMVTNGYCLDKIIDSIDRMKISGLQITLDGTKKSHDQTRHLINGNGTFDKIISNIDMLTSKSNINISIRMNVNTINSDSYVDLQRFLKERYPSKVHLYPAFLQDYNGGCKANTCYNDSSKKAFFLKKLYEDHGIYTREIYPSRSSKGCMSQQLNAFLIGPEGELYKCWHHLGIKEKEIGNIFNTQKISNYGLFADMMIAEDSLFDNNCKKCVLFPSCSGGCSSLKKSQENICIPAKSLLEDFIDIHYSIKTMNTPPI